MIPFGSGVGFPCRAPQREGEPRCALRIVPGSGEPTELTHASELRELHERRRHQYHHGEAKDWAKATATRVRKANRRDLASARIRCANPECTIVIERWHTGKKGAVDYCINCRMRFARFPSKRPRARRCRSCSEVFAPRRGRGRPPAFCDGCVATAAA